MTGRRLAIGVGALAIAVGLLALVVWLLVLGSVLARAQIAPTQCVANALASGTPDVITIPLLPCSTQTNILLLTASGANVTATPTLQQIGGGPALPILSQLGGPINPGDISGAGFIAILTSTGSSWVLLNPTTLVPGAAAENIGLIGPGQVFGNGTASAAIGTSTTLLTILRQPGSGVTPAIATALGNAINVANGLAVLDGSGSLAIPGNLTVAGNVVNNQVQFDSAIVASQFGGL